MMPAQAPGPLLALLQDFLGAQAATRGAAAPTAREGCRHDEGQGQRNLLQLPGRRARGRAVARSSATRSPPISRCGTSRRASSAARSACCATTSAATAQTDAPAGRYTFDLLIADAVALMDALVDQARRISPGCRWAAPPRSGSPQQPSRPARPRHRLRLALPVDAGDHAAMGGAHRRRRRRRAWRRWSSRRSGAGSRPRSLKANPPYVDRMRADDPHHAGERLHRLRGGARRSRLRGGGRRP